MWQRHFILGGQEHVSGDQYLKWNTQVNLIEWENREKLGAPGVRLAQESDLRWGVRWFWNFRTKMWFYYKYIMKISACSKWGSSIVKLTFLFICFALFETWSYYVAPAVLDLAYWPQTCKIPLPSVSWMPNHRHSPPHTAQYIYF